ncbi:hypothetical protein TUM17573_55200 [Klebsiella pneumoniae]|nr:hypothetical protein TUM17573_55200 [Klebsiella pneumoniae]
MCVAVNSKMQLSPDTTAFLAMLSDFPFAFTKDLQPGGINHQVCDFTPGGRFETDINRLCPLTEEGANKQVISSQADSLIKISRIWADFFPANTSNQPI